MQKNQFSNLETIYCGVSLAILPKSQGHWLEDSAFSYQGTYNILFPLCHSWVPASKLVEFTSGLKACQNIFSHVLLAMLGIKTLVLFKKCS